jgi:hypothetical protein
MISAMSAKNPHHPLAWHTSIFAWLEAIAKRNRRDGGMTQETEMKKTTLYGVLVGAGGPQAVAAVSQRSGVPREAA